MFSHINLKNTPCSLEINHDPVPLFLETPGTPSFLVFPLRYLFYVCWFTFRPTYPRDWLKSRWSFQCVQLVNIQRSFDCPCNQQPSTNRALQSLLHRDDQGTDSQGGSTQPKKSYSKRLLNIFHLDSPVHTMASSKE